MNEIRNKIDFGILKTQTISERIGAIIILACIILIPIYISERFIDSKLAGILCSFLSVGIFFLLAGLHHKLIVRGRVIGMGSISDEEIIILDNKFKFSDIEMLWIHFGVGDSIFSKPFKFYHFETVYLTIINLDGKVFKYHIVNIDSQGEIVTTYIELIKKQKYFFKIYFHEKKWFSKQECHKIIKKYKTMRKNLQNRNTKKLI